MNHSAPEETAVQPVSKTRLIIGGVIFFGGFLSPLLLPLVTGSDLPGNWKAVLSTGLVAGLPEVGMLLAIKEILAMLVGIATPIADLFPVGTFDDEFSLSLTHLGTGMSELLPEEHGIPQKE